VLTGIPCDRGGDFRQRACACLVREAAFEHGDFIGYGGLVASSPINIKVPPAKSHGR
jgi:hypothetical protein